MKYLRISLAATFALLLLAGCGTTLNDVLGTGTTPTNTQSYSGNVNYMDLNARRIDLNSNGYTTSIYWDSNTRFTYQNQNVTASSIRTGDYVTVQAYNNGNGQLLAQNVVDNGSMASGTYPPSGSTNGSFHVQGTVSYVDTTQQRIDVSSAYVTGLNTGSGGSGSYSVYYSTSTPVYFQGNTYSPTNLERGDQVDISAYSNGGRYQADSITVTHNVRQ